MTTFFLRRILLEKIVSAVLTACLVVPFDGETVVAIYIVLGHAHFLTAYYYKKLAGMVTRKFLANYIFWFTVIVASYYHWPSYHHLTAVTTVCFLFHMVVDEIYLSRLPMNLRHSPMHFGRLLETLPIILVFSAFVIDSLFPFGLRAFGPSLYMPWALKLSYGAFLTYTGLLVAGRYCPDWRSGYFLGCSLVLLYCGQFDVFSGTEVAKFTGTIIIYHYLNWYLHYYLNLSTRHRRVIYLKRVVALNAFVFALFLVVGSSRLGQYLFQEDYFYLWTMMHLITSIRSGDIVKLLHLPSVTGQKK